MRIRRISFSGRVAERFVFGVGNFRLINIIRRKRDFVRRFRFVRAAVAAHRKFARRNQQHRAFIFDLFR